MSHPAKEVSAVAPLEVRRCKLCGQKLQPSNPGKYCRHHRTEDIIKSVKDGRLSNPACTPEQVYLWVCAGLNVDPAKPMESLRYTKSTSDVCRARWAAAYLFDRDLGMSTNKIMEFFKLSDGSTAGVLLGKLEVSIGEDDVLRDIIMSVRERYPPKLKPS